MDVVAVADRRLAVGPARRAGILLALRDSPAPLTVAALAVRIGVHVNTVRDHLAVLVEAGTVVAETEVPTRRGRPRRIYRAVDDAPVSTSADARERVLQILLSGFGRGADEALAAADDAGWRWGTELVTAGPHHGELADRIEGHLVGLGMSPARVAAAPSGTSASFELAACPLADLAHDRPEVVCRIHAGMLRGACAALGRPDVAVELEPFAAEGRCRVVLRRS